MLGVLIDQIGFFAQMLLSGISTIVLLATLAKRELQHLEETAPVEEFVKERPAPISKGLHKMRGSSTSVDFRHIRSLSRTFKATVEPPTPIAERAEPPSRLDPFSTPTKGKGKAPGWGLGWQQRGPARCVSILLFACSVADVEHSASATSLLASDPKPQYSQWV